MKAAPLVSLAVMCAAGAANASVVFFNSPNFGSNAAERADWLAAAGISGGQFFEDFESYPEGTNLHGVALIGGAVLTHPDSVATARTSSSFFGTSNPIDTQALAMSEETGAITITFATPVDYVGGYDIDMPGGTLRVTLTDSSTEQIGLDTTGSGGDTAEFWGVWRNDSPAITKVEFLATTGGDGEWGLDNLEYGAVPEPGTMLALAAGVGVLVRRRRK